MTCDAKKPARLAVLGAGQIGKRHIEHILEQDCAELMAIVDPSPDAAAFAATKQVLWRPDLSALLAAERPDGVIVATPNQMHVANALQCVAAAIPVLVEKPIADDVREARGLVRAAEEAGVALLVGHHRRHNPMILAAKKAIESGRLGQIVSVHANFWLYKPDEYFDASWRRRKGAGPVFLNLIHDVDLLRYLCGEVTRVQAMETNRLRGAEVEETSVILLAFATGALATVNVSDKIVAPWSWELTSGENSAYPHTGETCYMIGGTSGSLTVLSLDLWRNPGKPSWWEPIASERLAVDSEDPLALQIRNFCGVIRGEAEPVVSGREGLATLEVIAAIKTAAASGGSVEVSQIGSAV